MSKLIKVSFIKEWGQEQNFSKEHLKLNQCSIITNRKKFFNSHIKILDAGRERKNKKALIPYYNRLALFYNLIKKGH